MKNIKNMGYTELEAQLKAWSYIKRFNMFVLFLLMTLLLIKVISQKGTWWFNNLYPHIPNSILTFDLLFVVIFMCALIIPLAIEGKIKDEILRKAYTEKAINTSKDNKGI